MDEYTVKRLKNGIIITGSIPMGDMIALLKCWGSDYEMGDEKMCRHFGAVLVAVKPDTRFTWRKELGIDS